MIGGTLSISKKKIIANEIRDITEEQAENDYNKLENINIKDIKPTTRIGNKFVDYFTFLQRLETTGKSGKSYFEYFEEKNKNIKKPYIKRMYDYLGKNMNEYKKWYAIFNLYQSSISIFKPVLAMEIYNKFKPHTILDPTMGWGGRLVGACALDVPKYIGIDLNKDLEKPYKEMTEKLKELGTKTEIKLMFKSALDVDYSKLKYDMVFTSPPYYNIEIYKGTKKQSKDEWDENFYKPLFEKTYKYLENGGYYILNVPIEVYERVCIPMFGKPDILFPLKKVDRKGSTSRTGNKIDIDYKEYIYIWKKKSGSGILNPELYEKVKKIADETYKKPSAYKSGFIVKKYKELGGKYSDDQETKPLKRWFKEEWKDIGNEDYPVYRPTKRISKETPLTIDEIDPKQLKEQIKLKQIIKGEKNLPKFEGKGLSDFSNYSQAQKMTNKYFGKPTKLYKSDKPNKKYYILDPNNKKVYFGQMGYEDFTKHKDEERRKDYRRRAENIKGNWKDNKYSPNNLAINILW